MKKVFLVKKDVTKQNSQDNWLIMSCDEFVEYKKVNNMKGRTMVLVGPSYGANEKIYAEVDNIELRRKYETENKRSYRRRVMKEELNITILSGDKVNEHGCSLFDSIKDSKDVEKEYIHKERIKLLYKALRTLSKQEQYIVYKLFFVSKKVFEKQLAEELNIKYGNFLYYVKNILKKLKSLISF